MIKCLILIVVAVFSMISCNNLTTADTMYTDYRSINLFKETKCFVLISAIEQEDTYKIERLCSSDTSLINFQEQTYHITPLIRACGRQKLKAVKKLLELGANPNLVSKNGYNPLYAALIGAWEDAPINIDTRIVALLLKYGADPNYNYHIANCGLNNNETNVIEDSITPLIFAINYNCKIEVIKLLVDYGANINYKTRSGKTAAISALIAGDINTAHYLIVERNAIIKDPYFFYDDNNNIDFTDPRYPVDLLMDFIFEANSFEYHQKQEIIKKFSEQGISYQERKKYLPSQIQYRIKKSHPQDWENYIEIY